MSQDNRLRIFTPLVESKNRNEFTLLFSNLVENLLLFETIIIKSRRLKEVSLMINILGFETALKILKSDAIEIHNDIINIASEDKELYSLLGMSKMKAFGLVPNKFFENNLNDLKEDCALSTKNFKRIRKILEDKVSFYPKGIHNRLFREFNNDINPHSDHLKNSIRIKVKKLLDVEIDKNRIHVEITRTDEHLYHLNSNLQDLIDVEKAVEYDILDSSLLAIGSLQERIIQMDIYNCISGFTYQEIPIFDDRLKFFENNLDPKYRSKELHRIVEIKGLPNFSELETKDVNFGKLLEIREIDEITNFRNWLFTSGKFTSEELDEKINGFRTKIGNFFNSNTGKTLNFIVSTGINMIPGVGQVIGGGLSLTDTFFLDNYFKQPGAISFLGNKFPSIYEKNS